MSIETPTYLAMMISAEGQGFEVEQDPSGRWRAREIGTFAWHSARSIAFALIKASRGPHDPEAFAVEAREWEKQILGAATA